VETGITRQIGNIGACIQYPTWSPAGDAIYFFSDLNGYGGIRRVDINKEKIKFINEPVLIGINPDAEYMDLSSGGDKMVLSAASHKWQIWRITLKNDQSNLWKSADLVIKNTKYIYNLDISPDGSKIVMEGTPGGLRQLRVHSLLNGDEYILYKDQSAFSPSWSPDGRWICFDAGGGDNADIWRIPAEGGKAEKIIEHPDADWMPTYAPDGKHICFVSNRSGQFELWIQNLETGQANQITNNPGTVSRGSWSHDRKRIAYFQNYAKKEASGVFIYDFISKSNKEVIHFDDKRSLIFERPSWGTDDKALYLGYEGKLAILDIETRKITIRDEKSKEGIGLGVNAIHGDNMYFISVEENSTLWLAEGLK